MDRILVRLIGLEKGTEASQAPEGADLLPVSLEAVERLTDLGADRRDWVLLICWALNFLYCTGWEKPAHLGHKAALSPAQKQMILEHIDPAVGRMVGDDRPLPGRNEVMKQLLQKGYGYDGSTWVVMEER